MFRHFCVIKILSLAKSYKFLKLRLLKLKFPKIVILKYIKILWNFMES
jgi:hypothetical protein